jgi:hypothetical protein
MMHGFSLGWRLFVEDIQQRQMLHYHKGVVRREPHG